MENTNILECIADIRYMLENFGWDERLGKIPDEYYKMPEDEKLYEIKCIQYKLDFLLRNPDYSVMRWVNYKRSGGCFDGWIQYEIFFMYSDLTPIHERIAYKLRQLKAIILRRQ